MLKIIFEMLNINFKKIYQCLCIPYMYYLLDKFLIIKSQNNRYTFYRDYFL